MEPLSISASIVGLLCAAGKVSSILTTITTHYADVPRLVRSVKFEAREFELALSSLQYLLSELAQAQTDRLGLVSLDNLVVTLTESVLTFSELETVLTPFAWSAEPTWWNRLNWLVRDESTISRIVEQIQRHKASISLMLNILQCKTNIEAQQSRAALHDLMDRLLKHNQNLSVRFKKWEESHEAQALLSRVARDGNGEDVQDGVDRVIKNKEEDNWTMIKRSDQENDSVDAQPNTVSSTTFRFTFERDLESSRVYKRSQPNSEDISFTSSTVRTNAWSMLSLADISIISFIALPIFSHEVSNRQRYTFGSTQSVQPLTPKRLQAAGSSITSLPTAADNNAARIRPLLSTYGPIAATLKRINKELTAIGREPPFGCSAGPRGDDL
ncbi:MAG: hypothetical protein Q9164_004306, partial [Protoblastenia rupestris]